MSLIISFSLLFFFRAEQDARLYIRQGDKNHAAQYLRQKKRALKEIESKDNQYQRLLEMMQQLGRTKQNKQILDVYKAGANAFKATLQRQGISPEKIDETMDDIDDAMAAAEEIQDAIAAGVPTLAASEINKDLEAELNAILASDNSEIDSMIKDLPDMPSEELSTAGPAKTSNEDDSIVARLKRLREPV
ncbi:unnamed protein product [Brugia timori]|uniref:Charged multivesicular body protein 7 n=1 Tax=Brugia timori TaxID=42155 RepID=A0A3P7VBG2_9BILA|nr:unnamed protein product [Brugia timori]